MLGLQDEPVKIGWTVSSKNRSWESNAPTTTESRRWTWGKGHDFCFGYLREVKCGEQERGLLVPTLYTQSMQQARIFTQSEPCYTLPFSLCCLNCWRTGQGGLCECKFGHMQNLGTTPRHIDFTRYNELGCVKFICGSPNPTTWACDLFGDRVFSL